MPAFTSEVANPLYAETMIIAMAPSGLEGPPLPTAAERLQTFSAIKGQTDALLGKIQSEQTEVTTEKKSIDADSAQWQQKLAAANTTIQKAELDRQNTSQGVIPYAEAEVAYWDMTVTFTYTNMPAGVFVGMNGDDPQPIPQGSGTMELFIPFTYERITFNVDVYDAQGNTVARLISFPSVQQHVRYGAIGGESIEQLWHIPGQTGGVTAEQEAAARAAKTEAETALKNIEAQRTALVTETDRLTKEMNELKRTKVPYARMYVKAVNHPEGLTYPMFTVRYQTPYPQTYFEMRIKGEPTPVIQQTVESPAGEIDRTIQLIITQNVKGQYANGQVDIYMYEDSTKKKLLEKFGGNFDRNTNKVDGESEVPWGTVEAGRVGDNALVPIIGVVKIKGPNALLFLQSPYNKSMVQIDGGGLFSMRVVEHKDGITAVPVTLTMSGDKPTGTYYIKLYQCSGCMELDSVAVNWDKTKKTLTLVDPADKVDSLDPKITQASEVLEHETALSSIDVSGTSVDNIQGKYLYQKSIFYIPGDQIEKYVKAAYPAQFPADINAYAAEQAKIQNKPASSIRDTMLKVQSDLIGTARTNLGYYEGFMGTIMERAVDVVVKVKAGESEATARTNLQTAINNANANRYMQEIAKLKITIPSLDPALSEGVRLACSELEFLLAKQGIIAELREEESYNATTSPPPELKLVSQAAFLGTLKTINAAHWDSAAAKKKAIDNYYMSQSDEYIKYYGVKDDPATDSRSQVALMLGVTPVVARTGEFTQWTQQTFDSYEQELNAARAAWQTYYTTNAEKALALAKDVVAKNDGSIIYDLSQYASIGSTTVTMNDYLNNEAFTQEMEKVFNDHVVWLLQAKYSKTLEGRQKPLMLGGFVNHHEVNTTNGVLIVAVNGHLQELGSKLEEAGMEEITKQFQGSYEILHFKVGVALMPTQDVDLLYQLSEQLLRDRLARVGIFSNNMPVKKIILTGYSWGGGTAIKFANMLEQSTFKDIPVHLAVIDAVKLGEEYVGKPETVRPPVESVFNRWQESDINTFALEKLVTKKLSPGKLFISATRKVIKEGFPARGSLLGGTANTKDSQKSLGKQYYHINIDDQGLANPILDGLHIFIKDALK